MPGSSREGVLTYANAREITAQSPCQLYIQKYNQLMNKTTRGLMTPTTRTWMIAALVACTGCASEVTGYSPAPMATVAPEAAPDAAPLAAPDAGTPKPDARAMPSPTPSPVLPDAGSPDVVVAPEALAPDAGSQPLAPDAGPEADATPAADAGKLAPIACHANGQIYYGCNGHFGSERITYETSQTTGGVCKMYSDKDVGFCPTGYRCEVQDYFGTTYFGTCL